MKQYFSFSKKEQLGLLVLLVVILLFAVFPFINTRNKKEPLSGKNDSAFVNTLAVLKSGKSRQTDASDDAPPSYYQYDEPPKHTAVTVTRRLFNFDPNTLNEAGWQELGLRERTIRTIIHYRNKGGRFRKPGDLQKIYGLHRDEFERLQPYIVISGQSSPVAYSRDAPSYTEKTPGYKTPGIIDINQADTTAYKTLYGIGSKLAARIVNFREKLGGFYSIHQVGETYGVPDSTFQKIKPYLQAGSSSVRKININTAPYEALNAHPYISSKLAYLIVKQRKIAVFSSMEAIKELVAQTTDSFEKVE